MGVRRSPGAAVTAVLVRAAQLHPLQALWLSEVQLGSQGPRRMQSPCSSGLRGAWKSIQARSPLQRPPHDHDRHGGFYLGSKWGMALSCSDCYNGILCWPPMAVFPRLGCPALPITRPACLPSTCCRAAQEGSSGACQSVEDRQIPAPFGCTHAPSCTRIRPCLSLMHQPEGNTPDFVPHCNAAIQAVMVVADKDISLQVSGDGDVLEPHDGIIGADVAIPMMRFRSDRVDR